MSFINLSSQFLKVFFINWFHVKFVHHHLHHRVLLLNPIIIMIIIMISITSTIFVDLSNLLNNRWSISVLSDGSFGVYRWNHLVAPRVPIYILIVKRRHTYPLWWLDCLRALKWLLNRWSIYLVSWCRSVRFFTRHVLPIAARFLVITEQLYSVKILGVSLMLTWEYFLL